jgi:glutamate--cysteine ligase
MTPSQHAQTPLAKKATALKRELAEKIHANRKAISDWTLEQSRRAPPPFYSSVDLRDSGHKIVPVDSNLFPAGFNNICPEDLRTAPPILRAQIEGLAVRYQINVPKKLLVIPESHTSNSWYIENLYYLTQLLQSAGFEVRVGWMGGTPPSELQTRDGAVRLVSATAKEIHAYPVHREDRTLLAGDFRGELILLNNDFSSGYPTLLDHLEQPVVPSHHLGWHSRKKSTHFKHYNALAQEFASLVGVDPWVLHIDTEEVDQVNFNEDAGIDRVKASVDRILEQTRKDYINRGISQEPFVFVKNNSGTYGMGIMVVHSGEELEKLNRRTKNKMSVGKNKLPIQSVAVQEGVPTATLVDRLAAEPVIYLAGCELIGGFLRTNTERGIEDNLNSQGMVFRKLCMTDLREAQEQEEELDLQDEIPVLELVYGAVARLSALAAGRELADLSFTGPLAQRVKSAQTESTEPLAHPIPEKVKESANRVFES